MKSPLATDRRVIFQQLAQASRCADEAQEPIDRQRTRVHMLHQHGYDTRDAEAELSQLVQVQTLHKEDLDRLRAELVKIG
jgi:hypothetical protein